MTDVEKYGLFAVVLVGGLLVVIAVQGGFSGHAEARAVADDALPVIMESPAPLHAQAGGGSGGKVVRVRSILPDKPFQWDESPAPYPGERSSDAPATVTPLSASTSTASPTTAALAAGTHAVKPGETLSDIAEQFLGSPTRWQELVKLNPGLNPKKLQIGQVLRVSGSAPAPEAPPAPVAAASKPTADKAPPAAAAPAAAAPAAAAKGRTHVVVSGDTLSSIAKTYLGTATRADDIYAANRDVLKSKDALKLGQTLKIP